MKKLNVFLALAITYLVIFSAFYLHRTSSGLKRKVEFNNKFKKILKNTYEPKNLVYEQHIQIIPTNEYQYKT